MIKRVKIKFMLFVAFLIYSANLMAKVGGGVDIFTPQKQTPEGLFINTLSKPEEFSTSNDLTRSVGSFHVATGELLYFKGVITDAFGVPIEGATVRIWQTNSSGKYQTLLEDDSIYIDKYFVMSGTAKTDNLGRFGFKTIFPGFINGRAPHINVILSHPNFGEIQTEVYFENHPLNEKDPQYMTYSKEDRKMLTANVVSLDNIDTKKGKIAMINFVMDGIHSYKGY